MLMHSFFECSFVYKQSHIRDITYMCITAIHEMWLDGMNK